MKLPWFLLTTTLALLAPGARADGPAPSAAPTASARPAPARPAVATSARPAPAPAGSAAPAGADEPAEPSEESAPNPHSQLAEDGSEVAPDLPQGTVEARIADALDRPLAGVEVRLGILSQKIAEGESRSQRLGKSGADGRARFDGLGIASDKSYRVTVHAGSAEYASMPFTLSDTGGQRVLLHVYPATSTLSETVVGMRGFLYVETRDDVFQLEVLFRIFNIGKSSWVPTDVVLDLPPGWKAFSGGESMFDSRFEAVEGRGAALRGTFPPGQRDVSFRFQLPKAADPSVSFRMALPPRVVEMRVIAAASREMGLEVGPGFETPQDATGPRGDRVLVTRRQLQKGDSQLDAISVTLSGLRVPGPGRWVAVIVAGVFGLFGALAARGDVRIASTERVQSDRARARELILRELVSVEHAKAAGELGPTTYERTHRALLDALARIGVPDEKKRSTKKKVRV